MYVLHQRAHNLRMHAVIAPLTCKDLSCARDWPIDYLLHERILMETPRTETVIIELLKGQADILAANLFDAFN